MTHSAHVTDTAGTPMRQPDTAPPCGCDPESRGRQLCGEGALLWRASRIAFDAWMAIPPKRKEKRQGAQAEYERCRDALRVHWAGEEPAEVAEEPVE